MAADKARMGDSIDDWPFDAADVGDDELAGFVLREEGLYLPGDGGDRGSHEANRGEMIHAQFVHGPELTCAARPGIVEVASCDMPAPSFEREGDRGADEP